MTKLAQAKKLLDVLLGQPNSVSARPVAFLLAAAKKKRIKPHNLRAAAAAIGIVKFREEGSTIWAHPKAFA